MSRARDDEWVRVEHADELRAAALVELRPCGFCGKTERFILLRPAAPAGGAGGASLSAEGDFHDAGKCWTIAPGLCLHPRRPFDPSAAIASGRLWRRAERQNVGAISGQRVLANLALIVDSMTDGRTQ